MVMIEPELRCPAPRPTRLRVGARRSFALSLALFLLLGGVPLLHVSRQIWAFQILQRDGHSVQGTVLRRSDARLAGLWRGSLLVGYSSAPSAPGSAWVTADGSWWRASPPGSRLTITACEAIPGHAALGNPWDLQLSAGLGVEGYGALLFGLVALVLYGSRLRPYFRDVTLVTLGTPVAGRVVGKSWKSVHRLGRKVALPMIHLHFRDPFGVERVRTQIVDGNTWAHVVEGERMTVLVCAQRRGWFAAYPLLLAEAAAPRCQAAVPVGSERV